MSRHKSAARRLGLLAGSSLVAASLAVAWPAFAADTVVTIPVGVTQTTAITASPAAGDTYTVNILGKLGAANANSLGGIILQGSGAGAVVVNDDGRLQGRLSFGAATGPITIRVTTGGNSLAGWHTQGVNTLGSGADLIETTATGMIGFGVNSSSLDFGAGSDRFVNAGTLLWDRSGQTNTTNVLSLLNLETFENSGVILMGSFFENISGIGHTDTDGLPNDVLNAQGVAFTGSGDSRIAMDVLLSNVTQANCTTLTAADCVNFTGGTTAGSTLLTINRAFGVYSPGLNDDGITLIVGSSAAEHFTLDPNSDGYVQSSLGGVVQTQLVAYRLVYDEATSRHMLVSTLADEAFQSATFASSAQETWRSTTGSWFDRQADLRATPGGLEPSRGVWARLGASASERESENSLAQGDVTHVYDVSHSQRTAHLMVGADVLGGSAQDSSWVLGVMGGMVRSDVEFDATPTEVIGTGFTGGVYGTWIAGPLFVDAVFNANILDTDADLPNMNLGDNVNLQKTVKSLGGRIEAGWRIAAGQGLSVEPLVGLSYVRTDLEDIEVADGGGTFDFDNSYASFRTGAGLRLGMDAGLMGMPVSFSLTGRYWTENEGEYGTTILIPTGDTSTALIDDFSGSFSEVAGSINLFSSDGGVSGFVNLGGKFADDYSSVDGALGVRMRW